LIVVINKLDSVGYKQERFDYVKGEVLTFLTKQVGFRSNALSFVPCSGFKGVNILSNKEEALTAWYSGPTLVSLIEELKATEKDYSKPTRFYVTEVLGRGEVPGISGLALAGKVEAGIVAVGDLLLLLPVGQVVTVKSIKQSDGSFPQVVGPGDSVEIGVQGMSDESVFGTGDVLSDPLRPIPIVRKFRAQIVVFQPPRPLLKGDHLILHMHSVSVQCKIYHLRAIVDKKTGDVAQKRPRLLPHKVTAIVDIRLDRPLCMELFSDCQQFGRFMLRTNSKTCAAGVLTTILAKGLKKTKEEKGE
jgi:translation elongation factor EF-1alpha